jgi:hypothetical protein
VRRYVNREITADDFVSDFLAARQRWIEAPSVRVGRRLAPGRPKSKDEQMADDLDRCRECYGYVDSTSRHRNWHAEQERLLRNLQAEINRLKRS